MKKMLEGALAELSRTAWVIIGVAIGAVAVGAVAVQKTPARDHDLVVAVIVVAATFLVWRNLSRFIKAIVYVGGTAVVGHLVWVSPSWYKATCSAVAATIVIGLIAWIVKRNR